MLKFNKNRYIEDNIGDELENIDDNININGYYDENGKRKSTFTLEYRQNEENTINIKLIEIAIGTENYFNNISSDGVNDVFDKMLKQLKNPDITINFYNVLNFMNMITYMKKI